jgi:hypothetical protein
MTPFSLSRKCDVTILRRGVGDWKAFFFVVEPSGSFDVRYDYDYDYDQVVESSPEVEAFLGLM